MVRLYITIFLHFTVILAQSVSAGAASVADGRTLNLRFTGVSQDTIARADAELWDSVKNDADVALIELYLKEFPEGRFAADAKAKIEELKLMTSKGIWGRLGKIPPNNDALLLRFQEIPPGEFTMGCSEGDCFFWSKPAHRVRLKAFEISIHEITQSTWTQVMGVNPSFSGGEDYPVDNVSWADVQEFIRRLNLRNDGWLYRLPTEAEWEYAALGGQKTLTGKELGKMGTFGKTSQPVGRKQPNAFGLYDMFGNVSEWVQDWFDPEYYTRTPEENPSGPATGNVKLGPVYQKAWDDWIAELNKPPQQAPGGGLLAAIANTVAGVAHAMTPQKRPGYEFRKVIKGGSAAAATMHYSRSFGHVQVPFGGTGFRVARERVVSAGN